MTANIGYNPRVLAAPHQWNVPDDVAQMLGAARCRPGWCVALVGLQPDVVSALDRAVGRHGATAAHCTSHEYPETTLCVPAHGVGGLIKELGRQGHRAAGLGNALRITLDAWSRRHWTLRCGTDSLEVGDRTLVMGIVNVTPDSFSDGGQFADTQAAIAHGRQLVEEGADILDIGGESTRPGAEAVDADTECERVLPVIEALASEVGVPISIDTSKAAVVQRAFEAGATMLNDVEALGGDPEMLRVAAESGLPVVLMHMQGSPRTMQKNPHYDNLMAEVVGYLRARMALAIEAGVDADKLVVDPGIGFGKTLEHNLGIMRHLAQLRSLGCPILLGTSRKSFIGAVTGASVGERVFGTAATVALGIAHGAHIVRVHDVAAMRQVAQMTDAVLGQ